MTDTALSAPPTPFKGLAPFGESELDTLLFFGREREIEVIAANLAAARLTILYGPSGVGKTSLLRAGVLMRLRRDEPAAVVVHANWSSDPMGGLRRSIEEEAMRVRPDTGIDLRGRSLADALADWGGEVGGELYVVLDQFEEYFLYHERGGPFEELAEIIRGREHRANFLISIREDALAQLDAFKTQIPNLFGNSLRLDRLDRQAAMRAIRGPIERYNELAAGTEPVLAEDELVEEVLDSVQAGRIQLGPSGRGGAEEAADRGRIEAPYLQLVLERLWNVERERASARLRLATLRELGGATRIVEEHLERAMSILSPEEQDAAAAMYNHLVTPSGTKIAHQAGDLARYAAVDEAQAGSVLDQLARERIIRAAEDGAAGPHYEIFHDVLTDAVLAWRARHEADRRLQEERREGARRQRRLLAIAGVSLVVVAVLAGVAAYALSQRGSAQDKAREADNKAREADANDLAALAEATVATSPERSLSLALEASEKARSRTVENALRSALGALRTTRVIDVGHPVAKLTFSPDGALLATAPDKRGQHVVRLYARDGRRLVGTRRGTGVSFGPGGRRLVTTIGRHAVVSDVKTGRRLLALRHPEGVLSATFSPDSSLIATTSPDKRVRLWNARTGRLLHVLPASDPDTVSSQAGFDRSSRLLVTWGGGPAALIYDVLTGGRTARLLHRGRITVARFGPTANVVATGGLDEVARLWDAASGNQLGVFRGHVGGVLNLAFSDSGGLVATASTDGTARVWETTYHTLIAILPGHVGFVTALDFSPGGELVVTGSRDRMARIFDADSGTLRATLAGHEEAVRAVGFDADARTVATASTDGTLRLWNAQPFPVLKRVEKLASPADAVAFEGSRILSAGRAEIRNRLFALSDDPRLAFPARGFGGVARSEPVALGASENGRVLVSSHRDGTIREWRSDDEEPAQFEVRRTIEPEQGSRIRYTVLGISPDGSRFVAGAKYGAAALWRTGRRRGAAPPFDRRLTSATFSPDGRHVLTTSLDHDARLIDVRTGQQAWVLSHASRVSDADFSADGRWVAIAGPGHAGVVDARTGERILLLDGRDRILRSVAFSPTGWRIVTGGRSGAVRTYDCRLCGGIDELIPLARRRLAQLRPAS